MESGATEIIFPPHAIQSLLDESKGLWRQLMQEAVDAPNGSLEKIAFVVMMARMNNCAACNTDSFRALHGCLNCARQTMRRFKGAEDELTSAYQTARKEVSAYLMRNANLSS
ncbi:MAG: hypothetical protein WHV44_08700 [Anaerolineales bacterium]